MCRGIAKKYRKTCKTAQVSIEYLIIVGFALAMTLPLLLIFNSQSRDINEQVTDAQANKVADEIITAIDSVYYLGAPSTKTIKVYFPDFIKNIDVDNQTISFSIEASYGDYEITRTAATPLDGEIRDFSGLHVITVKANPENVSISDN